MNTTKVIGKGVGIQWRKLKDDTVSTQATNDVGYPLIIGEFKRGRTDKPMRITRNNIKSMLGYDQNNSDYRTVQAYLDNVPYVNVMRISRQSLLTEPPFLTCNAYPSMGYIYPMTLKQYAGLNYDDELLFDVNGKQMSYAEARDKYFYAPSNELSVEIDDAYLLEPYVNCLYIALVNRTTQDIYLKVYSKNKKVNFFRDGYEPVSEAPPQCGAVSDDLTSCAVKIRRRNVRFVVSNSYPTQNVVDNITLTLYDDYDRTQFSWLYDDFIMYDKQDGHASYTFKCKGGVDVGDTSQGLDSTVWTARITGDGKGLMISNGQNSHTYPALVNEGVIDYFSFAFDKNMTPYIALQYVIGNDTNTDDYRGVIVKKLGANPETLLEVAKSNINNGGYTINLRTPQFLLDRNNELILVSYKYDDSSYDAKSNIALRMLSENFQQEHIITVDGNIGGHSTVAPLLPLFFTKDGKLIIPIEFNF